MILRRPDAFIRIKITFVTVDVHQALHRLRRDLLRVAAAPNGLPHAGEGDPGPLANQRGNFA